MLMLCVCRSAYCALPDVISESNVLKFIDGGDLTTFLMIIEANKSQVQTMYHVFSILYILSKSRERLHSLNSELCFQLSSWRFSFAAATSSELGKAGLVKATIDMIREKKSGKQGELLQMLLFTLNRMCLQRK